VPIGPTGKKGQNSALYFLTSFAATSVAALQVNSTKSVGRLRQAKDKAEFDQFMPERRNRPPEQASQQV
jgi:hypothetical protein